MSISTEIIVNRALHVSKVIDVFQRTIRHMKKEHINTRFPSLLFLYPEQFTDTNLFILFAAHFFWTCKYIYYLLLDLFASLGHIRYFDAAKFTIKLFSLVYLLFLLSDNGMNMKKWLKHNPLRLVYITSSPFQDVNLHKNSDNRVVVWWNQIGYT